MSGILGVFNFDQRPIDDGVVRRLLDRMSARGQERSGMWSRDGAALAAVRNEWELDDGFSGEVLVVEDGGLVIAADASIYYRKDLCEKLVARDVGIGGSTPSPTP